MTNHTLLLLAVAVLLRLNGESRANRCHSRRQKIFYAASVAVWVWLVLIFVRWVV